MYAGNYETVGGAEKMKVKIGKISVVLSPYSFFQPNSYQIENIYALIKAKTGNADKILDFYDFMIE